MLLYILITATAYLIYWIIYLMCSEVFMMESIVGAIIGAGGAILVGIFRAYRYLHLQRQKN